MDKEKALKILIANVYCVDSRLHCTECPCHEESDDVMEEHMSECSGFNDDDLLEAVKVLSK